MGVNSYDGNDTYVLGDNGSEDGVKITATIDGAKKRLDVDAKVTSSGFPSAFSKKLRYRDMNASTGGVARGSIITATAFTTLFTRNGSGLFTGLTINGSTMTSNWLFRFVIDEEEIFPAAGILSSDMNSLNIYNLGTTTTNTTTQGINFAVNSSSFFFTSPAYAPIEYKTSISVRVKAATGTKTFNAGLIVLTEET